MKADTILTMISSSSSYYFAKIYLFFKLSKLYTFLLIDVLSILKSEKRYHKKLNKNQS